MENISKDETNPFLKGAYMFLEAGEWVSATEYFQKVLDQDPKNASAHLGKLLAEKHVRNQEELFKLRSPFSDSTNYQNAVRYADGDLRERLIDCDSLIRYNDACATMREAKSEEEFKNAEAKFHALGEYRNAAELCQKCKKMGETAKKEQIYRQAVEAYKAGKASKDIIEKKRNLEAALHLFDTILEWRDSKEKVNDCRLVIDECGKQEQNRDRESNYTEGTERGRSLKKETTKTETRKKLTTSKGAMRWLSLVAVFICGVIVFLILKESKNPDNLVDENRSYQNHATNLSPTHKTKLLTLSSTPIATQTPMTTPTLVPTSSPTTKPIRNINPLTDVFIVQSVKNGYYIGLGETKQYDGKTGYYIRMTPEKKNALIFSNGQQKNGAIRMLVNNSDAAGLYLDAWNPNKIGYGVDIWQSGRDSDQLWAFEKQNDGSYLLLLPAYSGVCLTNSPSLDPKWTDAISLQTRNASDDSSQRWNLVSAIDE